MGRNGTGAVDYSAIDLPDAPRAEWHYTHRRAELFDLLREAGHPGELNQTELAERYDVSQQQISDDLDRLGEYVRATVGPNRRALVVDSVVQRSIRGMIEDGDYRQAAKTALEWDGWVSESDISTGDDVTEPGTNGTDADISDVQRELEEVFE